MSLYYCPGDAGVDEPEAHPVIRLVHADTPPWRCPEHTPPVEVPGGVSRPVLPLGPCLWCGSPATPDAVVVLRRMPAGDVFAMAHRSILDCEPDR